MFISAKTMPIQYIADAEKDVDMKNISPKEAIEVLKDMKIDIPLPEAAVMQRKRNAAIDMAIDALKYSEIPNNSDCISRQAAIEVADAIWCVTGDKNVAKVWDQLKDLPSAQPDAVTASLEELINDYGEDGYFIVDGVNYQANELLNELKINSSVGEKFRVQIAKTIVQYFMKFGG